MHKTAFNIASKIVLYANGNRYIYTEADFAGGGDIKFQVNERLYMTDKSGFFTLSRSSEQNSGGNISIIGKPQFFILGKDSRLDTTGYVGDGGNIRISADHFIESATSLIDASSTFGRDGEIWINASQKDFSENLTLPKVFIVDGLSLDRCA